MQDILTFTPDYMRAALHGQVPGIRAINAFFRSGFLHLDLFSGAHLSCQDDGFDSESKASTW